METTPRSPLNEGGPSPLDPGTGERRRILAVAREAIRAHLDNRGPRYETAPADELRVGAFVTLTEHGRLRGCIGRMESEEPLSRTVAAMAVAAAFEDPRFRPLAALEYPDLHLEITLLGPRRPVSSADEIILGRHGVWLQKGYASAVFLPQVATEQGWDRTTLLEELGMKAGLGPDAWKETGARLMVFEGFVFGEES